MTTIDSTFKQIEGYLISMTRDTLKGWYVLQIGIPSTWVFEDNDKIECDIIQEFDEGKIIDIIPKNSEIIIDDLVKFIEIIIKTNEEIAAKELLFTEKMESMKSRLENEYKEFYKELDELKENSFQIAGNKFVKELQENSEQEHLKHETKRKTKKRLPKKTQTDTTPIPDNVVE